jgi:serine/threonine protein kinase
MPSNQSKEQGDSIKNYNVYQQLGKGGFAQVYRAEVKETLQEVAIKIV